MEISFYIWNIEEVRNCLPLWKWQGKSQLQKFDLVRLENEAHVKICHGSDREMTGWQYCICVKEVAKWKINQSFHLSLMSCNSYMLMARTLMCCHTRSKK